MKTKIYGGILLLIATLIWGTSLVAQSLGTNHVGPFTFNAARFLIGAIVLLPFILFTSYHKSRQQTSAACHKAKDHKLYQGGIICGCIVFVTASLQQIGIAYTTVGKAGFITALYIVIVPILGLILGKHVPLQIWLCILLAIIGMYLLCMNEKFNLGVGDTFVLFCAISTAIHIPTVDYYSPRVDCVRLSCLQFFVCGALSAIAALVIERPGMQSIIEAGAPILYTGILSCGIAYTLQALGQKEVSPVATSLILSLESVFSVLSGWIILGESLKFKEALGCVLMFIAIVLSQIPTPRSIMSVKVSGQIDTEKGRGSLV